MEASFRNERGVATVVLEPTHGSQKVATLHFLPPNRSSKVQDANALAHDRISSIFNQMRDSGIFVEDAVKMDRWSSKLNALNFSVSSEENGKTICSFLYQMIYPKMEEKQRAVAERALSDINRKAKELLQFVLPNEANVDAFVEQCLERFDEEYEQAENVHFFLEKLLVETRGSGLFSSQDMERWESPLRNQLNPLILGAFLISMIQPAIVALENATDLEKLFSLEDVARLILKLLLPSEVEVESFIEYVENKVDDSIFDEAKTSLVEAFIQEQMELELNPQLRLARFATSKMNTLVDQIKNSPLFADFELLINAWEPKLRELNFAERDDLSNGRVLCLFLYDVVRSAFHKTHEKEIKKQILIFEYRLRDIMRIALPPDVHVGQYIINFAQFFNSEKVLREELESLRLSFRKQIAEFIKMANEENAFINQNCQVLKGLMQQVQQMRKLLKEEIFEAFDVLSERVDKLLEKSENCAEKISGITKQMRKDYQEYMQILGECEKMIEKV